MVGVGDVSQFAVTAQSLIRGRRVYELIEKLQDGKQQKRKED